MPESVPQFESEERQQCPSRIATYAANLAIASSLLVGANFYEGDEAQNVTCMTVSEAQIEQTEQLLEAPDAPALAQLRARDAKEKRSDSQLTIDVANLAAATEHMKLEQALPYTKDLAKDAKQGYKLPFSAYLTAAERYFDNFGIAVATDGASNIMHSSDDHDLTQTEQETATAKQNVIGLITEASSVPHEYLAYAGVKTIVLDRGDGMAASWNGASRSLEINVAIKDDAEAFKHELGHATSEELCSDSHFNITFANDGNIRNLNTQDYTYNPDATHTETPTRVSYFFEGEDLKKEVKNHLISKDQAAKQLEEDGKRVSFTDTYGATNPAEDSAQIGRYFIRPWAQNHVLNATMPRLREKTLVWLTRMRIKAPKLFAYVNDMQPPIGHAK